MSKASSDLVDVTLAHARNRRDYAHGWSWGPTARPDTNRNAARAFDDAADAYEVAADALEEDGQEDRSLVVKSVARKLRAYAEEVRGYLREQGEPERDARRAAPGKVDGRRARPDPTLTRRERLALETLLERCRRAGAGDPCWFRTKDRASQRTLAALAARGFIEIEPSGGHRPTPAGARAVGVTWRELPRALRRVYEAAYRKRPGSRAKTLAREQRYLATPERKAAKSERQRKRYADDPAVRAKRAAWWAEYSRRPEIAARLETRKRS